MKKLKLFFAALALLVGGAISASAAEIAWTNKTSLITNPSFETDDAIADLTTCNWATNRASGWTITPTSADNAQVGVGNSSSKIQGIGTAFTAAAGDKYFYLRENWNANTTFSVSQTIGSANLPAGFYRVTCKAATSSSTEASSKFTLTLREGENEVSQSGIILNVWHEWGAIIFKTSDATDLKITASMLPGAQGGSQHYCMLLDDFQLSYISASDAYSASESNVIDFSALINNAGIYNAVRTSMPKGWTAYQSTRNNDNFTDGTGDCMFEGWASTQWGGNGKLDIDYYQQIKNLPSGKYSLTAAGRHEPLSGFYETNPTGRFYEYTEGEPKAYSDYFVNKAETSDYSTTALTVTNGTMNIGVEASTTGGAEHGAWIRADNFRIYFKGFDVSAKASELSGLLNDAAGARDAATYVNVVGTEKTALQNAITTYTTGEEQSYGWYLTAISAVQTALDNFTAAKTNYDALVAERAKAKALGIDAATADSYAATSSSTSASALTNTQNLKVAEYTYVTTTYPYAVALGEWTSTGTNTSAATFNNEHWSGTTHDYKNQNDANGQGWNANSWSINFSQNVLLPAGTYVFKVAGRQASGDQVTTSLVVKKGEEELGSVNDFPRSNNSRGINKSGETDFEGDNSEFAHGGNGYGWEWRYVKFTLAEEATVNIAINSVATAIHQWVSFGDYTLQADNNDVANILAYNVAKADAISARDDVLYVNVKGSERTALVNAINADPTSDYSAATTALDNARVAFTGAKTSYDTFVAAKDVKYEDNLPYASSAKFAAIGTAQAAADATSASDAEAKTNAILSAYRLYVESNALAEGVGGIDKTNLISDANFSGVSIEGMKAGAWAFSQTGGTASILNGESFTDGDGNANYSYFDYNNNGANNQNLSQTLTALPKGQYLLTVTARATTAMEGNYYLSVDFDEKSNRVAIPAIGNTGGAFGRGWNDVSVVFNHVSDGNVTIHVYSENGKAGWSGATRFRLAKIDKVATISSYGWATFSSDYALDFTSVSGIEAYMITGHEGNVVTKTQITGTVPAGTGLLLKGDEGNYIIPVVASSETNVEANKLVAGTGAAISAEAGKTKYVLGVNDNGTVDDESDDFAEFQKITETAATVAKGKAYLQFNEVISGARALRISFDDITGVENVEAAAEAKAQDGKFVENGKIVIVKNGKKFNAAGQQVK